jgi:choline dehydrogenase-like flavoprotein
VRLVSVDPKAAPDIDPNFFGHPDDLRVTVEGLKLSREAFAQPAFAKHISRVVLPDDSLKSDDELCDFVRHHARTPYHPLGTCRQDHALHDPAGQCMATRQQREYQRAFATVFP